MLLKKVPLIENPDNTHCQQPCVKMVLKYFFPKKTFSDAEIDEGTAQTGGTTWFPPAVMYLDQAGLSVQLFSQTPMDYKEFADKGKEYIHSKVSQRDFQIEVQNGAFENITSVQEAAERMVEKGIVKREKEVDFEEISRRLDSPKVLAIGKTHRPWLTGRFIPGAAHYVVIIQSNDKTSWKVHDPGPPAKGNLTVGKNIQGEPMFSEVLLVSKKN